jgi:beta-glucosidase
MGAEADKTAIDGWYAPGVNLHRNAYLGRNFEYYSEDGVLSGKLAAKVIYGAKTNGLTCYLKHFVSSDSGDNPRGTDTWMTEQNLRENVLKPFEIAVKEGGANGMMSAFNDLGSVWCGANYALLTEILRDEWGFKGVVITDWTDTSNRGSMSIRQGIRAGNDLWLNPNTTGINGNDKIDTSNEIDMKAARVACKNILYSIVDTEFTAEKYRNMDIDDIYQTSGEIGFKNEVFEWWKPALLVLDGVVVLGLIVWVLKKKEY